MERAVYLIVVSDADPVAARVAARWGTPPATGDHVDGAAVRRLSEVALVLRRPGLHIHDEQLDRRLPSALRETGSTLVFPSIHRSEQGVPALTVHPLGNPGPTAEVGGRVRTLVPTDPRRMTAALRLLEEGRYEGAPRASFEATHHGPELDLPAFFVEIGYGEAPEPPAASVQLLSEILPRIEPDPRDRVAVGIGGGHYAPYFTDVVRRRRWAFGHILSRHALGDLDPATARAARATTPGASGFVPARAEDAGLAVVQEIGPRLREADAPRRERPTPASGT